MDHQPSAETQSGPFVIIPPTVLCDERLTAGEKLIYGRVNGFINKHGFCNGSNEYLGKYIGMSKYTVRNSLSKLYALGYLKHEVIKNETGRVIERRIFPTLVPGAVLPRTAGGTTPRTAGGTDNTEVKTGKKVRNNVGRANGKRKERGEPERITYYATEIARKLGDEKSISFYKLCCNRYNPERLLRKAAEIIADGGARNPGAVFVDWVQREEASQGERRRV